MKVIVTVGPSSRKVEILRKLKKLNVDCFRINLSHSNPKLLTEYFNLFKEANIIPALDTQGAQARLLCKFNSLKFERGEKLTIFFDKKDYEKEGSKKDLFCSVKSLFPKILLGEEIRCDFGELLLKTEKIESTKERINCNVQEGGEIHNNRALDFPNSIKTLPAITDFDKFAIRKGIDIGINTIFLSFASSKEDIYDLRKITNDNIKIISKIESRKGLQNLNEIIDNSDGILIDRGDLSREISIGMVPFAVETIMNLCLKKNKECMIATNVLDSMIQNAIPSRAEISDIWSLLSKGISGFVLAAEVAIGKNPVETVAVINHMINLFNSSKISFVDLIDPNFSKNDLPEGPLKSWF